MVSPIYNATKAARGSHKELAGVPVTLQRGTKSTAICRVTVGETRSEDVLEEGIVVSIRIRDFLIDVEDYRIDGVKTEPRIDDRIIQNLDGREVSFQVLPIPGEKQYRRSDRSSLVWRVHTKEARNNELG